MNVAALEIFNQLRFQHFGISEVLDANGGGGDFGHLRGAVSPCAKDNLEAALTGRPHKQERERTPWLRMVSAFCVALTGVLTGLGRPGPELTLASGAFLVGYLKRFGVLGAGIGSQIYIGQLLAYGARLLRLI